MFLTRERYGVERNMCLCGVCIERQGRMQSVLDGKGTWADVCPTRGSSGRTRQNSATFGPKFANLRPESVELGPIATNSGTNWASIDPRVASNWPRSDLFHPHVGRLRPAVARPAPESVAVHHCVADADRFGADFGHTRSNLARNRPSRAEVDHSGGKVGQTWPGAGHIPADIERLWANFGPIAGRFRPHVSRPRLRNDDNPGALAAHARPFPNFARSGRFFSVDASFKRRVFPGISLEGPLE